MLIQKSNLLTPPSLSLPLIIILPSLFTHPEGIGFQSALLFNVFPIILAFPVMHVCLAVDIW